MIVAFINTKGGTGKSTSARNLVFSKAVRKKFDSVAFVELDPQATNKAWWTNRKNNRTINSTDKVIFKHVSSTDDEEILKHLGDLETKTDFMVLDVPGESKGKFHSRFACAAADVVIIPMRTSTEDESAFEENLLPIIRESMDNDEDSAGKYFILPSFVNPQSNLDNIRAYLDDVLPDYINVLNAAIPSRPVFENYSRFGNTLQDYKKMVKANKRLVAQADKAIADVEKIANEVLNLQSK